MSETNPAISIIIPVYKVEKYLPACLNSVLAQTFQDWEAICVNDGSPDNCDKILAEYAQKDQRIKVVTQENQGVSVARNNALKQAQGDYICFLDSDDELAPQFLEKMYQAVKNTDSDVAWCDFQAGEEKQNFLKKTSSNTVYDKVFDSFIPEKPNMGACVWNKIYRQNTIATLAFPAETGIGEDLVFLYKAMYKSTKAVHVAESLYFYRTRQDSAIHSGLSDTLIFGNIKTAELLADYFKDKKLASNTRRILNQKIAKRIFKFAVLEPKRRDKKHLYKWYRMTMPLLQRLKREGVYQPKYLTLKNQLKSWWFFLKAQDFDSMLRIQEIKE